VRVIRATLSDVAAGRATLHENSTLYFDAVEISVVYYRSVPVHHLILLIASLNRAGYTPADYPTAHEWNARLLIEQSFAIKCPDIAYHLAGTKKVLCNLK
jgi:hypothetical protein